MNRLFAMMRYSKRYMFFCIAVFVDVLAIISVFIFNAVQLILIRNNNACLSSIFVPLNIGLVVLLAINLILIICFVIIKRHGEINDELKKN